MKHVTVLGGLLCALALSAPIVSADDLCDGDDGYRLTALQDPFPLGTPASVVLETPGSHQAWVLLSLTQGPVPSPWGRLCVGELVAPIFPIAVRDGLQQFDCGVPCSDKFLGRTYYLQFVAIGTDDPNQQGRSNQLAFEFADTGCGEYCPDEGKTDDYGPGGRHAWWTNCIGDDFRFDNEEPRAFVENGDGTARLTGTVYDRNDSRNKWMIDVHFSGRVDPGDENYPPEGSPKLELHDNAYVDNGGPVDPETWHYYTQTEGMIIGLRDNEGCDIAVSRMGPAFQVGLGANGKNVHFGASGWLDMVVDCPRQHPFSCKGDFNIDLDDDCR